MKLWALWQTFPTEVNAISRTLVRPNFKETKFLTDQYFNWQDHYGIHLSSRYIKTSLKNLGYSLQNFTDFECMTNVVGELFRLTVFDNYQLC